MDNKEKFYKLFKILKGWNLSDNNTTCNYFDFWNKKGNSILTLIYKVSTSELKVSDDVEFYPDYPEEENGYFEDLTLTEYRIKLRSKL